MSNTIVLAALMERGKKEGKSHTPHHTPPPPLSSHELPPWVPAPDFIDLVDHAHRVAVGHAHLSRLGATKRWMKRVIDF